MQALDRLPTRRSLWTAKIVRVAVVALPLIVLAACYIPPVWDIGDAIGYVDGIEVGKTNRSQVLGLLGDPEGNPDGPTLLYTGYRSAGAWFIAGGYAADGGLIGEERWWVKVYLDEKDVVQATCTSEDESDKRQACDRQDTQQRDRDRRELQEELSVARVGATRKQVEDVLGEPYRSISDEDSTVHLYRHQRGSAHEVMRVFYGPDDTVTRAETTTQRRARNLTELQEDLSVIRVGASREQVQAVLGEPDESEIGEDATVHVYRHQRGNASDVRYVTYGPDGTVTRAETPKQRRETATQRREEEVRRVTADLLAKAQCGDTAAQFSLGYRYRFGEVAAQDFTRAYFWHGIANTGGVGVPPREAPYLSERLTPEQIAEAERLMAEWEPKECGAEELAVSGD